ncbi:MAG TPA: ATP phosphoribosyltransferase regulatory subunit [Candidatus Competibacteraceae bacterium]|nr:MAG: ATP phosphoribosyltransferase regulatory subunit [Candidatus Competibacteraceae bacterium]HOB61045.1 ATP phosphoribosyltransferase regulatory subunit [Candidatus Competibacteraceae bacterium]HQA26152.1 ATP phosphoribosyltransferase regulatory subunit [Candidatus Competibacteraceae bacterium]HQD55349.1 ATP phosphoribosyltransferase regulatory subunit [Candidatus Competibacteraceae bacterium]
MIPQDRWLLPEGIEEILPPAAGRLEQLRRDLLGLYQSWGYELVVPPLIEFLESLLTGAGDDLELQTFKLTDQLSGRMMGVRADMTPQVARIDAHLLKREGPSRLCYMGAVLRTRADGFGGSRSPYQAGVELYGHRGHESDLEVLMLMLETLQVARVGAVHLDLGHVAIFRALIGQAGLSREREVLLFEALQRKALPEIRQRLAEWALPTLSHQWLLALAELNGGPEILDVADARLAAAGEAVRASLASLRWLVDMLRRQWPDLPIHIDLAELRGYYYHTGVLFSAYVPGQGQAVAQGGRYDEIGQVFGRARPATGFSTDLATLLLLGATPEVAATGVYAPPVGDGALERQVAALRSQGERVVRALPGAAVEPRSLGCDRVLAQRDEEWLVIPLPFNP